MSRSASLVPFLAMNGLGLYIAFLIPPLVIGFAVQHWLKKTVAPQTQVRVANGYDGRAGRPQILDRNGLAGGARSTGAGRAAVGPLRPAAPHGQPLAGRLRRQRRRLGGDRGARGRARDPAREGYAPFRIRSAMFPAVSFASSTWILLLMGGALLGAFGLVKFAILLYAVVVLFQLVTLPVEFDASRRAKKQLQRARPRLRGRVRGRRERAQRSRADLRRRSARRAHAAGVLRARLPRQPQLDGSMRVVALVVRAGAVVAVAAFVFSLVDPRRADPGRRPRRRPPRRRGAGGGEEARPRNRRSRPPSRSRHDRRRRRHRDGLDAESPARRRPHLLRRRRDRPRRRCRAREPRGDAVLGWQVEMRRRKHQLLLVPDATVVWALAEEGRVHGAEPRQQPRLRLRPGRDDADPRGARHARLAHTGRPGEIAYQQVGDIRVAVLGFAPYPWAQRLEKIGAARRLVAKAAATPTS